MRFFHRYLFNGNDRSEAMLKRLLHGVEQAASLNAAWEQGGTLTADQKQDIEDAVRDVAAALLGRDITIGAELPYMICGCGISGCTCGK